MPPWEKYAKQPEQQASGPWAKYANNQPAEHAPAVPDDVRARWEAARNGTLQALPESVARHEGAQAMAPAPEPSWTDTVSDMAKAGAAGVSRGVTGLMDLPGAAFDAGVGAGTWVAQNTGLATADQAQATRGLMEMAADQSGLGTGSANRGLLANMTSGASEFKGDTTAGEYAGTVGEFLPGSFGGGGGAVRNALTYGVIPGLASEAAGQATEGTVWEPWARTIAPIAASGVAAALTRPKAPQAPSADDLSQQAKDLYQVGAARAGADAASVQGLAQQIDGELGNLNVKTPTGRIVADGNVKKFLDVLDDYQGQPMTPDQMQTARRMLQDAAGSADPSDRRIGAALLEKFDDWRNQAVPEFEQADALYGRMKRARDVDWRIEKADRRAASTGTGGNSVNTARQNIRQILDNPKARRGYSPAEIKMMEGIVRGTPATNTLRTIGRLSPTSGALPLMGSLTGLGIAPQFALPAMGIAATAKGSAEVLTSRQIGLLSELIRSGGKAVAAPSAENRGLLELLTARSANGEKERKR